MYYTILVNANIGEYMESCYTKNHIEIREKLSKSKEYISSVEKVSTIFSLLGEPNRMKIILALMEGELCVYHICEITGGKQSATSQHLRKLKDNHVVKCRKEANQVLYSIADEHIYSIVKTALLHKDCK
ncbi:MAG: metalloregulator ArsR/SmtB family transcription factor [Clostridia bacterium]|nr:metalloregulator ArsR/SmtB family transcription factor [Clostridia bacterium]